MKKLITLAVVAAVGLGASGCEWNGVSSSAVAKDILREVNAYCGPSADSPKGGVKNIMLMEGREDDFIVTCGDGTNKYIDG